jgi:hypothetical protein
MYDRLLALGRWPERPLTSLAEPEPLAPHVHGDPVVRGRGTGADEDDTPDPAGPD